MLQLIGIVVVFACVIIGFTLSGGHLLLLWHPTEVIIICGAAIGAFVTSNPPKVIKDTFHGLLALLKKPRYNRETYVDLLRLLNDLLTRLRKEVPNSISLSGHTDTTPYAGGNGFSNWELSADRANAARRGLLEGGLAEQKISRAVGLASAVLFDKAQPTNPVNRRISIIVLTKKAEAAAHATDDPDVTA